MSDLITRQAAIDAINKAFERVFAWDGTGPLGDKVLENVPSAQPEPQWIPCSERMPEEHEWLGTKEFGTTISDEVYVTFENEKGERFCRHMSFQNGELSSYDQFYMDTLFKGSKPIAWMPFPEPYKPNNK